MPDPRRPTARPATLLLLALLAAGALAPAASALDVSAKAVRVVGSTEYSESVATYSGQASGFTGEFNGEGIAIAILDTGVDDGHRTFDGAFYAGAQIRPGCLSGQASCMQDADPITAACINPDDGDGHGTHVASIALGRGGSGVGARGIAAGAKLVDVKIATDVGGLSVGGIAAGIRWVIEYNRGEACKPAAYPVRVISISYASTQPVREQDRDDAMVAVREAWDAGILVVAAAGNCGPGTPSQPNPECPSVDKSEGNTVTSPGAAPEALTVGAVDDQDTVIRNGDTVAPYSSRGPNPGRSATDLQWRKPDVVAPGSRIAAACAALAPGNQGGSGMTCTKSGTSMATPHVSGIAAILFQAGNLAKPGVGFTPAEVKGFITGTAEDWTDVPGWDSDSGHGYVDAYRAIVAAVNRPPRANIVVQTATPTVGEQVVFDASLTSDPDDQDEITRLTWDFGDGSPPVEVSGRERTIEHTYASVGTYTVRLTALDSRGATDTHVITITVEPPPPEDPGKPPVPKISYWPPKPRAGEEVHFDASNSTDPDGDTLRQFQWDFDQGKDGFQADVRRFDDPKATFTYAEPGVYRVGLRIIDEKGNPGLGFLALSISSPPPGPPDLRIVNPKDGDQVQAGPLLAAWVVDAQPASGFTLYLDGSEELQSDQRQARIDVGPGPHTLRVVARGPGGTSQAWVNFTAVEGSQLQTNSADDPGCSTHTHGDGTVEEHCSSTEKCRLYTHADGRTETICGALPDERGSVTSTETTEENEAPVPALAVLLVVVAAVAFARRRRG